jgi:hypothetical protein
MPASRWQWSEETGQVNSISLDEGTRLDAKLGNIVDS